MNDTAVILSLLRKAMKKASLDAIVIPITDPHLGEYVPSHWRVIEWLTGFTGSAGAVVITAKFAGLWTDSRYFIQADQQLKGSGYELVKLRIPHTPEYIEWLAGNVRKGGTVGIDGRVLSIGLLKQMEKAFMLRKIEIHTDVDLVTPIWPERPQMPSGVAFDHLVEFVGRSRLAKIDAVREKMIEMGAGYHLLTSPDDIMWLLNIRGSDVDYSPLLTSYALITTTQVLIFANESQIPFKMRLHFDKDGVVILPYEDTAAILRSLPRGSSLLLNPGTTSAALYMSVKAGVNIIEGLSVPTMMKAVKNTTEIENIRKTMVKDGVALTKFFHWLETHLGKEPITEVSAATKLLGFRMEQEGCVGESFATISAWNDHAALPHYSPSVENDTEIGERGIYLLDSGGQYYGGTTDVTRSISIGEPTLQQKRDFTLALKGTISLASVKFPFGTKGYQIEVLARKALWDNGLNYGHGTGHGVGYFLNVHEGPQTIGTGASGDLKTILEPGMLTADEPAIYRTGEYGFRTENLLLCIEDRITDYGRFLKFETVTLACIDKSLIDNSLLTSEEVDWLDEYHQRVYDSLSPLLGREVKEWLRKKTTPIGEAGMQ